MEEKVKVINMVDDGHGGMKPEARWKTFLRDLKDNIKTKISDAWNWCVKNKSDLIVLVPLGLATVGRVKKEFFPAKAVSVTARERDRVDRNYYDPSTGVNWTLRRPLKNWEKEELLRRRRNGEYTETILRDMRVLER